jgi:hypothetical protein
VVNPSLGCGNKDIKELDQKKIQYPFVVNLSNSTKATHDLMGLSSICHPNCNVLLSFIFFVPNSHSPKGVSSLIQEGP